MKPIERILTDYFPEKKTGRVVNPPLQFHQSVPYLHNPSNLCSLHQHKGRVVNSPLQSPAPRSISFGTLMKQIKRILTDFFPEKNRASGEPAPTIRALSAQSVQSVFSLSTQRAGCEPAPTISPIRAYLHNPSNPCSLHQHKGRVVNSPLQSLTFNLQPTTSRA